MSNEPTIHEILIQKPVVSGIIGTIAGWGTAFMAYIDQASKLLAFMGIFCGTVTAAYTMIIVIKRYNRDCIANPPK